MRRERKRARGSNPVLPATNIYRVMIGLFVASGVLIIVRIALMPIDSQHGLSNPMTALSATLAAIGTALYGLQPGRNRLWSVAGALAFLFAAGVELVRPTDRPWWFTSTAVVLLLIAFSAWLLTIAKDRTRRRGDLGVKRSRPPSANHV